MPEEQQITKATLHEISWTDDGDPQEVPGGKQLTVQFNPQSLKVSFANQKAGGDQKGGGAIQFVGTGTTKLSLDLLFDVTVPLPNGQLQPRGDVRLLTQEVAYFIKPQEKTNPGSGEGDKFVPPGVRLIWGSFIFEGVVDSINETLELFSSDGKPLRATVALSLSRQDIFLKPPRDLGGAAAPQTPAQQGDTMQKIAARQGQAAWQDTAAQNGIENPRQIPPGTPISSAG